VPVVIILAALAILGGIVVAAMGRGGELARQADDQPSVADFETGADVAHYRPPPALLGYHAGATEYALLLAGRALADRDAEIAWLRTRLRELQPEGERREGELRDLPGEGEPGDRPGHGELLGRPGRGELTDAPGQAEAEEDAGDDSELGRPTESVTQAGQAARGGDQR
jgi:hypothetical protein